MAEEYVMQKGSSEKGYEVGLWNAESGFGELWKGELVQGYKLDPSFPKENNFSIPERGTAFYLGDQSLFFGTNLGTVRQIYRNSREIKFSVNKWYALPSYYRDWDMHGGREKYESNLVSLNEVHSPEVMEIIRKSQREARSNLLSVDCIFGGVRDINGIVRHQNKIYYGDSMGVFQLSSKSEKVSSWVTSFAVWDTRLLYVPTTNSVLDIIESGKLTMLQDRGSLVEVGGNSVVDHLTPFDGSGYKQGEYSIVGDTAFVHHGNWPGEKIFRRSLKTGDMEGQISIPTSIGFIPHRGEMFDIRNHQDSSWITSSIEGNHESNSVFGPANITSAISGEKGIYITVYNCKKDTTKVIVLDSNSKGNSKIGESLEGRACFKQS